MITDRCIRMCKTAGEIQKLWRPQIGDYAICSLGYIGILINDEKQNIKYPDGNECIAYVGVSLNGKPWSSRKPIWLPTQSQLQSMITNKGYFRFSLIELFYRFANANADKFDSMDEIWLAFVMKMLYNKVWDDEKDQWIKEV